MIVWGGQGTTAYLGYGAIFDPQQALGGRCPRSDAPSPRMWHTAYWSGSEMVVWGGSNGPLNPAADFTPDDGGIYNPATDTWRPMSTTGAPAPRTRHTVISVGSEMIIWGGYNETGYVDSGVHYLSPFFPSVYQRIALSSSIRLLE